jgi:hypothetical protein
LASEGGKLALASSVAVDWLDESPEGKQGNLLKLISEEASRNVEVRKAYSSQSSELMLKQKQGRL